MGHWTLDDIDWAAFDRTKADVDTVRIIKAASLVEHNGDLYGRYLANVFSGDEDFVAAAEQWAVEEVQHGIALARWANMADPDWDFKASRQRFCEGYQQVDMEAASSVRGSRCAELIARCIVEVGTSSYYSALADSTDEPVLKQICKQIAADEFRHYKLFYEHMKRYNADESLNTVARIKVALVRMAEGEDDELAFAYYAANDIEGPYDRKACAAAHGSKALTRYQPGHIKLATNMTMKAVGLKPQSRLGGWFGRIVWRLFDWRRGRMVKQAPAF
ncbi:MAG: rubrerythrin family protein [Rhodospirillaceae bacterium]|nr:rubrerythrin family protein [Rhodospirillaceae bacterium]|tara:strand:+ start:33587 stop:34411 length:825 start_codon:yes stop_codon:yes gene_type:complete